ncbi:MAG: glycerate kinase [Beutenbergiaceae bacterium]
MRVLIAPDFVDWSTGGAQADTVGALDVAAALAAGWAQARPEDLIAVHPMSTGGGGMAEVIRASVGGELDAVVVTDAMGTAAPGSWLRIGHTIYLEAGPLLGSPGGPHAAALASAGSSAGLGDLLLAAVAAGASKIVLGLPQVGSHDAGIGMLRALAARRGTGTGIQQVVADARAELAGVDLLVAAGTDTALVGLSGAGAGLAQRPGLDAAAAQRIEQRLAAQIAAIDAAAPEASLLPTPDQSRRLSRRPYSGAGGGVAFALSAVGARVMPAAEVVASETGLARAIADADLILTACHALDGDALALGVPGVVGRLAQAELVPAVALGVEVLLSRRELSGTGLDAYYPVLDPQPAGSSGAAVDCATALSARAGRVARTWSR